MRRLPAAESNGFRVLLLGFTVPRQEAARLDARSSVPAAPTHAFAHSLVSALRAAGAEVSLVSARPVPDYPAYPQLFLRGGTFDYDGSPGLHLWFVNLPVLKHLTRSLALVFGGLRSIRRTNPDVLLVHGVHLPFLTVAAWLGARGRAARRSGGRAPRTIAVLTDPPGVARPIDGPIMTLLRRWDRRLVHAVTDRLDGVVGLTDALGADLAPNRPRMVMEGIVSALAAAAGAVQREPVAGGPFRVVYAGGVNRGYGVDRLITAVERLDRDDVVLDVYGTGDLADELMPRANGRVRLHGHVPQAELFGRLLTADLLVNPRSVSADFVRYSFPSKLLEYMALGVPVLTTPLPTLPADYGEHVLVTEGDEVNALMAGIMKAVERGRDSLHQQAEGARVFILGTRSSVAQGQRLLSFAQRLP